MNPAEKKLTAKDVADLVHGSIEGDPDVLISGVNTLEQAGPNEASFLANAKYRGHVRHTKAGLLLVHAGEQIHGHKCLVRVPDPYLAFALLQRYLHPQPKSNGVRHPTAVIDETAEVAKDVDVGPCAVIGAHARIGSGSRIGAGCVIGAHVQMGRKCLLHPRCVVADGSVLGDEVILQAGVVIGADGFGYAWDGKQHLKIPQTGRVVLGNNVEIGANSCIDRGALGDTIIEDGVKLDNLIQVGHNVRIGSASIMASQVGVSGSTVIGKGCQIGGQAGFAGHLRIGDGCRIAAKTGVMGDLEAGGIYAGIPAMPHRKWLKVSALLQRLPELLRRR